MNATPTSSRRSRRAFTLIEAIVVIVIIGVLASVIAPPLLKRIGQSKQAAAAANAASIAQAVKLYQTDNNGTLPETLDALLTRPSDASGHVYLENADQLMDPWGHKFLLVVPPQKNSEFDVVSYGADGKPGGTGDDADVIKP